MQPLAELPKDDPFWQMMERIWADRKAAELSAQAPRKSKRNAESWARMWKETSRKPGNCRKKADTSAAALQRRPDRIHDRLSGRELMRTTAHRYIVTDDQILSGEPIIKDMRTPVRAIVELWRQGMARRGDPESAAALDPGPDLRRA